MGYAPIARIILRYVVGGVFVASPRLGETLAADPDVVAVVAFAVGACVEAFYIYARRKGGAT